MKTIVLTLVFLMLAVMAFARFHILWVIQKLQLDPECPMDIVDYVTNTGITNSEHYIMRVLHVETNELRGTDLGAPPGGMRICKFGNESDGYWVGAVIRQQLWSYPWFPDEHLKIMIWHAHDTGIHSGVHPYPNYEYVEKTIELSSGGSGLLLIDPADWLIVPPAPVPTYSFTVNSNITGAAIYKNGEDTGKVTPYTFTGQTQEICGVYSLVLGDIIWKPASYNYQGTENQSVDFLVTFHPDSWATIGGGTTYNDSHSYPAVYGGYRRNAREQYIVTASELTAAGVQPGMICSIKFNVANPNGCGSLPFYSIWMGTTDATEFTDNNFFTDLTSVLLWRRITPTQGWNTHQLATPFYWDGTSNIVIQTSFSMQGAATQNASTYYTTTSEYRAMYYCSDSVAWNTVNTGTRSYNRPNIMIGIADEPELLVNPSSLDFGRIPINGVESMNFRVINTGGGTLNLTGISPWSDGFFELDEPRNFPMALEFGQSWYLSVVYSPTAVGNHSANFNITAETDNANLVVSGECYDPVIYSIPYCEEFEYWQTDGTPVREWTQYTEGSTVNYWMANSSQTSFNCIPRNGAFNAILRSTGNAWLMRPFSLQAGQSYTVEVWARQDGLNASNASVGFYYGTDGTPDAMNNIIVDQTGVVNSGYQFIYGSFTPAADGIYWIGIHGIIANAHYLSIDSFWVTRTPPGPILSYFPTPLNLGTLQINTASEYQDLTVFNYGMGTLNLSAADISIIGDDAAMFEFDPVNLPFALTYRQTGIIPVRYCPTTEGAHTAALRMVHNGINYDAALEGRALGANALFESFEGYAFPPYGWTLINEGGSNTWFRSETWSNTGVAHAQIDAVTVGNNDWLITPKLAPSDLNHTFSFYGRSYGTQREAMFNVLVFTGSVHSMTTVDTLAVNVQADAQYYMLHSFDLSAYIGQHIYLVIQAISAGQGNLLIDDVYGPDKVVTLLPAPVVQITLSGSDIVLTWEPIPDVPPGLYMIYASEDPYNFGPEPIAESETYSYTIPATEARRFFRVVYVDNSDLKKALKKP